MVYAEKLYSGDGKGLIYIFDSSKSLPIAVINDEDVKYLTKSLEATQKCVTSGLKLTAPANEEVDHKSEITIRRLK